MVQRRRTADGTQQTCMASWRRYDASYARVPPSVAAVPAWGTDRRVWHGASGRGLRHPDAKQKCPRVPTNCRQRRGCRCEHTCGDRGARCRGSAARGRDRVRTTRRCCAFAGGGRHLHPVWSWRVDDAIWRVVVVVERGWAGLALTVYNDLCHSQARGRDGMGMRCAACAHRLFASGSARKPNESWVVVIGSTL